MGRLSKPLPADKAAVAEDAMANARKRRKRSNGDGEPSCAAATPEAEDDQLICEICECPADPRGANWYAKTTDARGRQCPLGSKCIRCGEFCAVSSLSDADIQRMKKAL